MYRLRLSSHSALVLLVLVEVFAVTLLHLQLSSLVVLYVLYASVVAYVLLRLLLLLFFVLLPGVVVAVPGNFHS